MAFNGLILAGGQSSRMGQDKALLKCPNGETLLQRATQLLKSTGAQQVYISSHNPQLSGVLIDDYPNRGPVSGIHAALVQTQQTPLLVLPVDMPLIQPDTLEVLLQTGFDKQQSCCFKDQCLPLFITNSGQALSCAQQMLSDTGNVSVWRFIKAIGGTELECQSEQVFKNANDPQQWRECLQLLSIKKELSE